MPYRNYSQSSIGGNVQHRNPIGMDLTPIATAIQTINNNALKVAEQKGAIAAAINKLPLNAKEDAWKANYINNIQKQIDASAQKGDIAGALEDANRLANEAVFSPEVVARVKANNDYETARKEVNERYLQGKISADVRDWWLANNQYKYEDVKDDAGNIIGGKEFTYTQPLNKIDYTAPIKFAASITAPRHTGSSSTTTSLSGLTEGGGSNKTEITEAMLDKAMSGVYNEFPGLLDSLLQDMKVDEWKYDELEKKINEETNPTIKEQLQREQDVIRDRLFEGNIKRTQKEYNSHIINPALYAAAYSHTDSSSVHKEKGTTPSQITGYPTGYADGGYGPLKPTNSGVVNIEWTTQANAAGQAVLNATNGAKDIISH